MKSEKNVPRLRFPEFRGSGEWEEMKLEKIGRPISGLSGKSASDFGTGKPYVTYMQVFNCAWIDFTKCGRVLIADNENQNTLQLGDILFTTSSETPNEVGFASVLIDSPPEPTYLNSFCFSFRPNDLDMLIPKFSCYLFHSTNYRKSISALAQGITRYNISKGAFLNLRLLIPKEKAEQQKIADCLSSLDDLISAQSQKIEALKAHKKGLMQQLFPAEGETTPKWRFPEFRESGWGGKTLGQVGEFTGGGTPSKDNQSFWKGNIPWISSSDIDEDSIYQLTVSRFITAEALKNSATKMVPANSILLVSRVGVGKLAITKESICTSQDFTNFTPTKNDNLIFIAYYLKYHSKDLLVFSQGMAIKGFTKDNISKFKILIPSKKAEQQKIADCLSSLDDLISAQSQKLEALKAHKKGLMQQLFPAADDRDI
ncbi:MAG: restriction endonuclease subunit S [Tannerella sp.]|jgi:type I restriction enzyme S subunit|nr:restriction endonuclease subunit S [Tannerella sp.]